MLRLLASLCIIGSAFAFATIKTPSSCIDDDDHASKLAAKHGLEVANCAEVSSAGLCRYEEARVTCCTSCLYEEDTPAALSFGVEGACKNVECCGDGDCAHHANGPYCIQAKCYSGSLGDPCEGDGDCKSSICVFGTCRSGGIDGACEWDTDCNSNICVKNICRSGGAGGECEKDTDCTSYNCVQGACRDGKKDDPCDIDHDCFNFCSRPSIRQDYWNVVCANQPGERGIQTAIRLDSSAQPRCMYKGYCNASQQFTSDTWTVDHSAVDSAYDVTDPMINYGGGGMPFAACTACGAPAYLPFPTYTEAQCYELVGSTLQAHPTQPVVYAAFGSLGCHAYLAYDPNTKVRHSDTITKAWSNAPAGWAKHLSGDLLKPFCGVCEGFCAYNTCTEGKPGDGADEKGDRCDTDSDCFDGICVSSEFHKDKLDGNRCQSGAEDAYCEKDADCPYSTRGKCVKKEGDAFLTQMAKNYKSNANRLLGLQRAGEFGWAAAGQMKYVDGSWQFTDAGLWSGKRSGVGVLRAVGQRYALRTPVGGGFTRGSPSTSAVAGLAAQVVGHTIDFFNKRQRCE